MADVYQYTFTRHKVADISATITGPAHAVAVAEALIRPDEREDEALAVLLMDNKNHVIGTEIVGTGGTSSVEVRMAQLFRAAVRLNATGIILAHNHPSGIAEPSQADEMITGRLRDALALVDIRVLDHIVVGDGTCVSYAERGLL